MTDKDRTVHAVTALGSEVVRYGRRGEWLLEPFRDGTRSKRITVRQAAKLATDLGSTVRLGLPGGKVFDRLVVKIREGRG